MSKKTVLPDLIREKYPFPISHAYTYLESRVAPEDRYKALLACFEVTLKTVASISLANFMRDIQEDPAFGDAHLFRDLLEILSLPLSLGHWHEVLRRTLRPYDTCRKRLLVPKLFDFYYRITDQGKVRTQGANVTIIQRFIQERNEEAHHRNRSQTSTVQVKARLTELEEALDSLLNELRFLADYELLYVESAERHSGSWHYSANIACGVTHPFAQRILKTTLAINSHRCLLLKEKKGPVLELYPFVIVTSEGQLQKPDIFFFDGVFSSGRANFMSYHTGDYIDPTDEESRASVASDSVNSLLKLLQNRIPQVPKETEDPPTVRLSAAEMYNRALVCALEHGERQVISLDALRQILDLSREEARQQERRFEAERGIQIEPEELEIPFEARPTWVNVAYYVLDTSGQEEMYYKDIAAEAEALKDQLDPNWTKGDSDNVEGTISATLSKDPRFYKLRLGYFRLTKHNELLSNPSWANLACFVLQRHDPPRKGMHLRKITERAVALKEKYSDWRRQKARTPRNTLSATMSMDHRFEAMKKKGYWRLVEGEVEQKVHLAVSESPASMTRDMAYESVLAHLAELGEVQRLPFGRTYYALDGHIHLMLRFSKAHHRNDEIEYFLGVTPQYFQRIDALGNAFMVFVLGTPDNVLLVPGDTFAEWVEGLEPSGSGTWPMVFYQSLDRKRLERWVPGGARSDVSGFLNDFEGLCRALQGTTPPSTPDHKAPIRLRALLDADFTRKRPELRATVRDAKFVEYQGRKLRYTDWGIEVTGWSAINIYREVVLDRTGQTLGELRKQVR